MKISLEKQKEILLESFSILKGNFNKNTSKLGDIVSKMFSIDIETAIEMWTFLLNNNIDYVRDPYNSAVLTNGIYLGSASVLGVKRVGEIVFANDALKQMLFRHAAEKGYTSMDIIIHFICEDELDKADELLGLVYCKKGKTEVSFGDYLEFLVDQLGASYNNHNISEQGVNLILSWAEKVKDPEEKAKINVSILQLMSNE